MDTADVCTAAHSGLACEPCRRRKARCDRTLPRCDVCSRSMQTCTWPSGRLKPGPRLGSTRRKRPNDQEPARRPRPCSGRSENQNAGCQPRAKRRQTAASIDVVDDNTPAWSQGSLRPNTTLSPARTPVLLSPDASITSSLNGVDLSNIIHPSHETQAASPEEENFDNTSGFFVTLPAPSDMIMRVCRELDISLSALRKLTDVYFAHMTTFSLFHQPSFGAKIQNVKSPSILKAGFAAMLAYAARFETPPPERVEAGSMGGVLVGTPDHSQFHRHSLKFLEDAIAECADEPPSLCLVQVLILTTFNQLIQGVRGRAWRSLGLCVRMAYELGLHEIDSGEPYRQTPEDTQRLTRWCFDEERRRAWWAIWEMDAFASTIRRCPLAIDWTEVETYLPVLDDFWFEHRYHRSCFLKARPIDRVRALRESKNEGPNAWLIVVISLMREAHLLSKPKGLRHKPQIDVEGRASAAQLDPRQPAHASERLAIISHALRCYSLSLPKGLRYRNGYLSFDPADSTHVHSAIFNIHCMSHLATLMLYHNHLGLYLKQHFDRQGHSTNEASDADIQGLRECIDASDEIFTIIKNSSRDHFQHVNPFLSSTVWFAAAVQLAYKYIAPPGSNTELIESKVELFRMNCQQYAEFWSTPDALLENLSILESHLESQLGRDQSTSSNASRQSHGEDRSGQNSREWNYQMDASLLSPHSAIPSEFHDDTTAANTTNPYRAEEYGGPAATVDDPLADFSMENIGMELDFSLDAEDGPLSLDDFLFDSHAA